MPEYIAIARGTFDKRRNGIFATQRAKPNLHPIADIMSAGTLGEVSIQAEEGALFVYSAGMKSRVRSGGVACAIPKPAS